MAWYDNNRSGYNDSYGGDRSGYNNGSSGNRNGFSGRDNDRGSYGQPKKLPSEIRPQKVPENYVDEAEKVMRSLLLEKEVVDNKKDAVTTSKIRGMLNLVTEIYNKENLRTEEKLEPESKAKIDLMRVHVVYEYGRDTDENNDYPVQKFITQAHLLDYLKGISTDRADLIRFAHYMEALVAYHRYYGGREG